MESLGPVQRDIYGNIEFEYFLKVFTIAKKSVNKQFADEKKILIERRRQALSNGDENEYSEIVGEMMQQEEQLINTSLMGILEEL